MMEQAPQKDKHQTRLTSYLDSLEKKSTITHCVIEIPSVILMVPSNVGCTAWLVDLQNVKHD